MIYYAIYERNTDRLVVNGSLYQCAAKLKIRTESVQQMLSRIRRGKIKKYVLYQEDTETGIAKTFDMYKEETGV